MRDTRPTVRYAAIAATAALMLASFIGGEFPRDQPLHHVPTCVALVWLARLVARGAISAASLASILGFLVLHIVGARWVYSNVPYDEWCRSLVGWAPSERLGLRRNHYDRLVHFAYGALATAPHLEFLRRRMGLEGRRAIAASFVAVLGASAVYEVAEWIVAVAAAPDQAERYNGQQGDPWDAQKDMALAALGALIASPIALRRGRCARRTPDAT